MQLQVQVEQHIRYLDQSVESEHFRLRYRKWSHFDGHPGGVNAIRHESILTTQLDALERLYSRMRSEFDWAVPRTDASGKTHVYVMNTRSLFPNSDDALTWHDIDGVPYVLLPCHSKDPTLESAIQHAAADAAHEAAHVFLDGTRDEPPWSAWGQRTWFDESIASYLERTTLADNPHWLVGCRHWSDRPDVSLDAQESQYAGLFAAYLVRLYGTDILKKLWDRAGPGKHPLHVLNDVLTADQREAASPDPSMCRTFGEYCADSYFVNDPASPAYAPEVAARFGARAPAATLSVPPSSHGSATADLVVEHLACQYCTIPVHEGLHALELSVQSDAGADGLRAYAAVVGSDLTRGAQIQLQPNRRSTSATLHGRVTPTDLDTIHHIVVTVANCSTSKSSVARYRVEVAPG